MAANTSNILRAELDRTQAISLCWTAGVILSGIFTLVL